MRADWRRRRKDRREKHIHDETVQLRARRFEWRIAKDERPYGAGGDEHREREHYFNDEIG